MFDINGTFAISKSQISVIYKLQVSVIFSWAVFSNEQMSNRWPFSLLNDEQIVVGKPGTKDKTILRADRSKNQQLREKALHKCSAPSNVDSCSLSPVFDTWRKNVRNFSTHRSLEVWTDGSPGSLLMTILV